MSSGAYFLFGTGLVVATTLGAGVFALPFVFYKAGTILSTLYLLVLALFVGGAHLAYWDVLVHFKEKRRLLGLLKGNISRRWFMVAFLTIIGGLLLTLVIYLILGAQFMLLLFPFSPRLGFFFFWLIASTPLLWGLRPIAELEFLATLFMVGIVLFVFADAPSSQSFWEVGPVPFLQNFFLPFGPLLFALTGWTAVEPLYEMGKGRLKIGRRALLLGTILTALLYLLFVQGVFGSAREITENTLSGLTGWPTWKLFAISVLGLFAIWTSYVPIGLEIERALREDLGWDRKASRSIILFIPPALLLVGFNNFLGLLGLVGGLFLSLQYVYILFISEKLLEPSSNKKLFYGVSMILFGLAAIYEVYYFVLH